MEIFIFLSVVAIISIPFAIYGIMYNKKINKIKEKSKLCNSVLNLNSLYDFYKVYTRSFYFRLSPKSKYELDNIDFSQHVKNQIIRNKKFYSSIFEKVDSNRKKYNEYLHKYSLLEKYTTEEEFSKLEDMKINYETFLKYEKDLYEQLKIKEPVINLVANCYAEFSYPYGKYIYSRKASFGLEDLIDILDTINEDSKYSKHKREIGDKEIKERKKIANISVNEKRKQNLEKARLAKEKKKQERIVLEIKNKEQRVQRLRSIYEEYLLLNENEIFLKYVNKFFEKEDLINTSSDDILKYSFPTIEKERNQDCFYIRYDKKEKEFKSLYNDEIIEYLEENEKFNEFHTKWKSLYSTKFQINKNLEKDYYFNKYQAEKNNSTSVENDFIKSCLYFYEALISQKIINKNEYSKDALFLFFGEFYYSKITSLFKDKICEKYDISIHESDEELLEKLLGDNIDYEEIAEVLSLKELFCDIICMKMPWDIFKIKRDYIKEFVGNRKKKKYLDSLMIDEDKNKVTIEQIDLMSGIEFENCIASIFDKMGYSTTITKASNDQGVDIIAKKKENIVAIQAKCYSGVVGNHAIMEAVAGMKYYNANQCMVITNRSFTKSAKELAKANNVELWDRKVLEEKLKEI